MPESLDICVNTQTPLVQVLPPKEVDGAVKPAKEEANLWEMVEGVDYRFSPGGVTRMVYPLVRRLRTNHVLGEVDWVALNPTGPRTINLPGLTLYNVALDADRMASYGRVKEAIWGAVHGLEAADDPAEILWTDHYSEYAYYNRASAEAIQKLDRRKDFDAFYVHDFQQLAVGHMLQTLKPKIFRWHIPFDTTMIPEEWKPWLATYFNSYDLVVVSSKRYLASLKAFGHSGKVVRLYPYVDPLDYSQPPPEEVQSVCTARGVPTEAEVILVVGRMDPMKGQDRAIRGFARLAARHPTARLVLVGNGSFSGAQGPSGRSKSDRWRGHLERLARELNVEGRVVFTGHLTQRELDCFYERAKFTVLPSVQEGFGLVVVESWLHRKPTIVTERAGIAELVETGRNGLIVNPEDEEDLSEKMVQLLTADPELNLRLGEEGFKASKKCVLDTAVKDEARILERITGAR